MLLKSLVVFFSRTRLMATFKSRTNIVTGMNEWLFVDDDQFDYQQELARSAFADMLHDDERNIQYEKAIEKTIRTLSKSLKTIHVLDIGTGTGLLSMMAARASNGSSVRITACEVFQPMARIARKCIEKNGFEEKIRVIDKRSTELNLEKDFQGDRINVIVAEVFDTELIGEGALRTFAEACQHLTVDQKNLRIIPARATIFLQLVESTMLEDFHTLKDISSSTKIPDDCRHLAGHSIFDLNINEIRHALRPLSKPIPVFDFDFKHLRHFTEEKLLTDISCEHDGRIDALIMWWNLDMDEDGEIQLGTTPFWCSQPAKSSKNDVQWREHWIHGIFYPQQPTIVKANEKLSLYCFHDEYSLYFDVGFGTLKPRSFAPAILSRTAIAAFNSDQRRQRYLQALEQTFSSRPVKRCLYIGDGLLLPLLVVDRYPQIDLVILQSSNLHLTNALKAILGDSKYSIISTLNDETIDVVLSEPFFSKSILPWDNLHYYYLLQQNRHQIRSDCQLFPRRVRFRCIALEFDHLHKIRSPVGRCRQFDLTPFDEQILAASSEVDESIEPQPLFEYSAKRPRLSSIIDLFEIDFQFDSSDKIEKKSQEILCQTEGICNGIAFWIDYQLNENIWLTTGIETEDDEWVPFCKQGVHLLPRPLPVQKGTTIPIETGFDFKQGQFLFEILHDQKTI